MTPTGRGYTFGPQDSRDPQGPPKPPGPSGHEPAPGVREGAGAGGPPGLAAAADPRRPLGGGRLEEELVRPEGQRPLLVPQSHGEAIRPAPSTGTPVTW